MAPELLADLLLLLAILGLGVLVACLLLEKWTPLRLAFLAFPIGSGLLTWLMFLASWAGLRVDLATVAAALAGAYLVCLGILWARRRNRGYRDPVDSGRPSRAARPGEKAIWLIGTAGLFLVLSSLFISLSSSYSLWDSIAIWSLQGYGIAYEGSIFGAAWGAHGLAYPMNIPMMIAIFSLAGGDSIPGSKVIFPLYYASLLVGVYGFCLARGMGRTRAGLGVLCLATIPVLFRESTSGYANAAMVTYLVLGGMALLEGVLASSRRDLLLGGVLLGFACWTRVEGILYVMAILVACLAAGATKRRPQLTWAWALVPIVVIVGPWLVFYRLQGSGESQAMSAFSAAFQAILAGQFHLGALRVVLQHMAGGLRDSGSWGAVWILAAALVALFYHAAPLSERRAFFAFVAMGIGTAIVTVLLFYVGSFGVQGLQGWLDRSFNRAHLITPVLVLLGALMLLTPSKPPGPVGVAGRGGSP